MTNRINIQELGFQRNLIRSPRCEECENRCIVLYDSHHDEYFSMNCGTVILAQGQYQIPYEEDYHIALKMQKKKLR